MIQEKVWDGALRSGRNQKGPGFQRTDKKPGGTEGGNWKILGEKYGNDPQRNIRRIEGKNNGRNQGNHRRKKWEWHLYGS